LVPPHNNLGDFTIVIETMSHDHSYCIRPGLPPYNVSATQNVTFQLTGGLATNVPLYVWYTHLNQDQNNTDFELVQTFTPENGQFTLELDMDSVFTVSTLTGQRKGWYPPPPPAYAFPDTYSDNFEGYAIGQEANYFMDQTGVWEIYQGSSSLVMRQQVLISPIVWCGESNRPISLFGDYSESDANLTIDALIETTGSVTVGLRAQGGGCGDNYDFGGYFFSVDQSGNWNLSSGNTILQQGQTSFSADKWYTLTINTNGSLISGYINGAQVVSVNDTKYQNGFSAIGTGWNYAQFDNVILTRGKNSCGTGDYVKIIECGDTPFQKWEFASDGTLRLLNTSNCLQVNGTDPGSGSPSVRTLPCNAQLQSQIWKFDGTYIMSAVNGYCLDITKQSTNDCAAVEIYACDGGSNQQWQYANSYITTNLDGMCLSGNA